MKQFTILKNDKSEIKVVNTDNIYNVVHLNTGCDHSLILHADGDLEPTDGYYPQNEFEDSEDRLVVQKKDVEKWGLVVSGDAFSINYHGETIDVIDVTEEWMKYPFGKAVECGCETIVFDNDGDDRYGNWWTIAEVDAETRAWVDEGYIRGAIFYCDNGWKIKSTLHPKSLITYEFMD